MPLRSRILAAACASLAVAATLACSKPARVIAPGQAIHHDDFVYVVNGVDRRQDIGTHHTDGTYYVVLFTVENHAKRVNHTWNDTIAYVVDAEGRQYENSRDLQRALAAVAPFNHAETHVTAAGQTETTTFVFDLPAGAGTPLLGVRGSFLMGDLFDGIQFRRVRVKLY